MLLQLKIQLVINIMKNRLWRKFYKIPWKLAQQAKEELYHRYFTKHSYILQNIIFCKKGNDSCF